MLTTNNNDILFDDLALLSLAGHSGQSANFPITYGDCDNRFETENHGPDDITVSVIPSIDGVNDWAI